MLALSGSLRVFLALEPCDMRKSFDLLSRGRSILPQSLLGKAIRYALNQWDHLTVYLGDGRVEIDNNLTENAIRPGLPAPATLALVEVAAPAARADEAMLTVRLAGGAEIRVGKADAIPLAAALIRELSRPC